MKRRIRNFKNDKGGADQASPISRPNATSPRCMTRKRGEIEWDVASSKSPGTPKSRTYLSNSKILE